MMSLLSKLPRGFVLFTLIFLLFCSALAEAVSLEDKVVEFEYANGLRLMVVDRPETPVVSAYITIGVGSVHETSETRGVAHLLEHMLFKGTRVLGTTDYAEEKPLLDQIEMVGSELDRLKLDSQSDPEQVRAMSKKLQELQTDHKRFVVKDVFSKIYAENGGVGYNAFTGKDLTTYLVSLPSNKLELWALIESDRMQNAVLREFYTERDVIREERRRSYETNPGGLLYETLMANAFTVHPYRDPIIGWHSDIANLSLAETRTFLGDYYAPINTVIALVGDVRPAEAFDLVNRYFGHIPPGTPVPKVAANEPVQNAEKRVTVFFDAEPQLSIAFHKPTLPHKDDYVFDLIDQILAQGRTSRFYQNLVEDLRVATSVSAYMAPGSRYPNLFVINAVPRYPHSVDEVEQAIYSELEKLKEEPVAEEELVKARNRLVTDQIRHLKSNNGLARMLTSYQSIVGDWRYLVNYQHEIEKITVDDIMAAAKTYFVPNNRTVVTLIRGEDNNAPKS